jgi:hypothetical protein
VLTPVICLIFTFLIKELASDQLPKGIEFSDNIYPYDFGDSTLLDETNQKVKDGVRTGDPARDNPVQWYLY